MDSVKGFSDKSLPARDRFTSALIHNSQQAVNMSTKSYPIPFVMQEEKKRNLRTTHEYPYIVSYIHLSIDYDSSRVLHSFQKVGRPPSVSTLPEPGIEPGTFRSSV